MANSVFKGEIKAGSITARFLSDFSNVDPDLLTAQYADFSGDNPQTAREVVAPGGSKTVTIHAPKNGLLEIMVDTGHDNESGRLQVNREGATVHDEPIQGPVRWVYSVAE